MARTASAGSVCIAWLITAAGMLTLVMAFKILSVKHPECNAGIYQYAQAAYGEFTGFNAAWGYWLCTAFSNVAYAVMLNDAFGAFFPSMLNHGWATILFGSALIWVMFFIVACGIRTAKIINTSLAVVKVILLIFIVIIFCAYFNPKLFQSDLWGDGKLWQPVGLQIKNSMMVTLFCFFGVEGAVMLSARAKRPKDVGRAGVAGFLIAWVLYLLVSVLCFGLMSRYSLSDLPDPSIAYILQHTLGSWAYYFVIISVIIALLGGWVAWTLVVAQVPYEAAAVGILPKIFLRTNRNKMPTFGLLASSIAMEIFLLMVVTADNVYLAALHITGLMILPCYLFTALYLWKQASGLRVKILAALAILFCAWMIYAGGIINTLLTSVFYLCGIWFFIQARKENGVRTDKMFHGNDRKALVILCGASLFSLIYVALAGLHL